MALPGPGRRTGAAAHDAGFSVPLGAHPIDAIAAPDRPYLPIAELAALTSQPEQVRRF